MTNWRNWRVGDLVEVVRSHHQFAVGAVVRIKEVVSDSFLCAPVSDHTCRRVNRQNLRWNSRPTK